MAKHAHDHPKDPQHSKISAAQARTKGTKPDVQSISAKTRGLQQKAQSRRQGNR
ncbi:hypothetical protein H9Y04_18700 [Streptomyces sp. TRM66268-LWL]|uniref:DUF5302 domain-containing protein n=1 Tax=Streptomyces polyasparticus TaxID=2767826 RepID=A0ABR7SGH5_9ACTN|nr:hypothetical protein [Streptomyces polyasparticus]MBC9714590.1 hypothetical protein [Streptomyces polyasparticus]